MNISDHTCLMRIRDLFDPGSGMEKFGSGIRNKYIGSATLVLDKKNTLIFSAVIVYQFLVIKTVDMDPL
jgi:hypothetical protein